MSKLLRLKNPVTVTAYQSATQAIKQTHLLRVSQRTLVAKIQYKTKNKSPVERHYLLQSTYYVPGTVSGLCFSSDNKIT